MPLEIPEDYIRWRLENFWGYGSLDAPVWFVGMEEGLSNGGEDYLPARFAATNGKALVDIRRDMINVKDHYDLVHETDRGNAISRSADNTISDCALFVFVSGAPAEQI